MPRRDAKPVRSRRMGIDHLDHPDVDPERHPARALLGAHLALIDQLRAVEVPDLLLAQIVLERRRRGGLGSQRGGFPTSHISAI